MYLASAYPNSALSALTMMVIAFVMAGCLAAWLGLVFLADREPRRHSREPKGVAVPGRRSEELATSDEGGHRVEAPGGERESTAA